MLLQSIKLKNLLSFRDAELELRALNVLIGSNASGKSNLIAAIGLLKAAPENLEAAVQRGGGNRRALPQDQTRPAPFESNPAGAS
jgi:predicted ATPase